ncbi:MULTISPECIES: hypothetical protein [Mycobacterium avium complex (MAC)]|uniref:Uncharacterized protein n=1 Tax=Mycobacterium intracellulare TaxID=1767 RepID=A0AAE4RA25_MYCIT|nr:MULTISPECIES: hypothetical protein [Mycobacterium avium complex (MAC)]MCA2321906.1 hypothetical protein [Mycobacterium intracellulare]MCA2340981.1 hypothetical protein [Mycobacterium intracellulare]MDV6975799.1 hypothetical protein [Mycobacterium intracellulare]MDV6984380.1 hypothetical protein [Mycobacterium intracellulare]MDV7011267.1 hypothetical protein [Mycobacterium intracellulare]
MGTDHGDTIKAAIMLQTIRSDRSAHAGGDGVSTGDPRHDRGVDEAADASTQPQHIESGGAPPMTTLTPQVLHEYLIEVCWK